MISACMTVSVRELRTAVREWACCVNLYSFYHTDHRLSFLMKTPKGGFRQELHSVHFL